MEADTNKTLRNWKIATAVLGVLCVVLLAALWHQWYQRTHDLAFILEEGKEDITDVRSDIANECEGSAVDAAACQAALDELADILRSFGKNIEDARSGATGAGQQASTTAQ